MINRKELLLLLLCSYNSIMSRCTDVCDAVIGSSINEEKSGQALLTSLERDKYRSMAIASSNKILQDWKNAMNKRSQAIAKMKDLELMLRLYLQHEESLEKSERIRKAKGNDNGITSKPGGAGRRKFSSDGSKGNKQQPPHQDGILTMDEMLGYTWHNPNFSEGEVRSVIAILLQFIN